MELSGARVGDHGFPFRPHLFVHTEGLAQAPRGFVDARSAVRVAARACFRIAPEITDPHGIRDLFFEDGKHGAELQSLEVESHRLGGLTAWVLHLSMRNYAFFTNPVVARGLRLHSYVQVRQGLGLGGCTLSLEHLLPWLGWSGCRQLLSDGEAHHALEKTLKIRDHLVRHGAPGAPPAVHVALPGAYSSVSGKTTSRSFVWSGFDVAPAALMPAPGVVDTPRELADCIRGFSHPGSSWWRKG